MPSDSSQFVDESGSGDIFSVTVVHTQPLSDLSNVGTLVDPDEDTDLTIVGYTIA